MIFKNLYLALSKIVVKTAALRIYRIHSKCYGIKIGLDFCFTKRALEVYALYTTYTVQHLPFRFLYRHPIFHIFPFRHNIKYNFLKFLDIIFLVINMDF